MDNPKICLPKLNHENPVVKQYLIDAAKWWRSQKVTLTSYTYNSTDDVSTSFWIDFSKEMKSVKKDLVSYWGKSTQMMQFRENGLIRRERDRWFR